MADLTTLKDVKAFLGNTTKEHDELLTTMISGVTSEIQKYLNATIVATVGTFEMMEVHVPSDIALTTHRPIIEILSLQELGVNLLDEDDYEVYPDDAIRGEIFRVSDGDPIMWSTQNRAIKLLYTHGYATIPEGIAQAATSLVAADFYASVPSDKARFGLRSRSMATGEDVTFLTRGEVWEQQASRLAPWIRNNN